MYRITCRKLLILIRLAIVLSLAGYSLSNAYAAMHRTGDVRQTVSVSLDHGAAEKMANDHHGDVAADHDGGGAELAKQDCCQDFCVSLAIIGSSETMTVPVATAIHAFIDDRGTAGEIPALHRPPNI